MDTHLADASINTFGPSTKADYVPHSKEEPVFILTSSQLRGLITQAVEDATQPFQDEVLRLNQRITSLESLHDQDVSRICLDIAYDRQRLAKLEKVEAQPIHRDRGEILRALLAANNGKMLARDARKKMHLSRSRFSELLSTMGDYIEVKPYHLHKNWNVLILL